MKGNDIRDRLHELGRKPNRRYGQHFLVDQSVLNAIVLAADIRPGDRVLEIGPGLGVLTETLLETGASVTAIEKDRTLANDLVARLGSRVRVIEGDALEKDWAFEVTSHESRVTREHGNSERESWKLVANIPYNISSQIIRKALWSERVPMIAVMLVQHEVASRVVEGAGSLLALSVALASSGARIIRKVPSKCFYPPPEVQSAVIRIDPLSPEDRMKRWGIDPERVLSLASRAFANPRKKISTSLGSFPREVVGAALQEASASPDARPEELSVEQWAKFAKGLAERI